MRAVDRETSREPESVLDTTLAAPEGSTASSIPFSRWLSVDQIRKMQRMRRETVVEAMLSGELPFEQRGRSRFARFADVLAWEERRLQSPGKEVQGRIAPELYGLL